MQIFTGAKNILEHKQFILDFTDLPNSTFLYFMKLTHKLTYQSLRLFSKWLQKRSFYQNQLLSQKLSGLFFHFIPIRKPVAISNIARSFPQKSSQWKLNILKKCYQFFTHNFIRFLSFPSSYFLTSVSSKSKDILDMAIKQRKGVIIITGHFGAWELLSAWLGYNGYPIIGVAHRQRNLGSDQFFKELRERSGFGHIFRKEPIDKMYQVLSDGKMLGLVSDQDTKSRGVFVNFLNQPASTPKGAARFYKKTGAPMVFVTCVEQSSNKYEINCQNVLSNNKATVKDITQRYTTLLEAKIMQHPEQYFWWHRRWKTKPV